ncbi:hypothetical protein E2C01_008222 [Portunus trituberculatus]|uniref:Uncharacterized protein n=1 Tax=Portunus trituberculatus TaxID=210409 RepID=A0A5B7D195_PORTR|nr:hypothetical protein [Portunus trituberculatus]
MNPNFSTRASLCRCLEGEASWLEAQVEWVLLVLVGDVLEIMVTSDEEPHEAQEKCYEAETKSTVKYYYYDGNLEVDVGPWVAEDSKHAVVAWVVEDLEVVAVAAVFVNVVTAAKNAVVTVL